MISLKCGKERRKRNLSAPAACNCPFFSGKDQDNTSHGNGITILSSLFEMSAPPPPAPFTGIAWKYLTDNSVGTGWIYLDEIYLAEITLRVFGLRITTWLTRQEPWHTVDPPWHTDAATLGDNQKELHRWNLGREKVIPADCTGIVFSVSLSTLTTAWCRLWDGERSIPTRHLRQMDGSESGSLLITVQFT